MNNLQYFYDAVYKLYPQVVRIDGNKIAYDEQGNIVEYDQIAVDDETARLQCKQQAQEILYKTDWTTIPDVADPAYTPYLMNQIEFKQYRAVIRDLAVNPVANPVWPTQPIEQWSN